MAILLSLLAALGALVLTGFAVRVARQYRQRAALHRFWDEQNRAIRKSLEISQRGH